MNIVRTKPFRQILFPRCAGLLFVALLTLIVPTLVLAQNNLLKFTATSASSCPGQINFFGFQEDSSNWMVQIQGLSGSSNGLPDVHYTWSFSDSTGVIASGGYDSQTGSYGGTGGASNITFLAPTPVYSSLSQLSFTASGYTQGFTCNQTFMASTIYSDGSGGTFGYQ